MPIKELNLNLRPLIKKFEAFLKKNTYGELTGSYVTAIKGKGLEFEGFRPYSINDDASTIDWKATLRSQETLVKKYVEERNVNVFFLFDVSNSMLFASTDKLKAEYSAEIISSLCFAILQAGDYAGMAMFTDTIVKLVPLMMGSRQYYILTRQLSNPQLYGGSFDLSYALKFTNDYLRPNSLLIIVSDFLGISGDWEKHLTIASQKFEVLPIIIRDPHDLSLPSDVGQVVIVDPYSDQQMVIDPNSVKEEFEKRAAEQNRHLRDTFKRYHVPLLELSTTQSFVNPVMRYLKHPM